MPHLTGSQSWQSSGSDALAGGKWGLRLLGFSDGEAIIFALLFAVFGTAFQSTAGLQRSARSDLTLLLFSTLIIALVLVGGTFVILFNLGVRMMKFRR